jgi:catalase
MMNIHMISENFNFLLKRLLKKIRLSYVAWHIIIFWLKNEKKDQLVHSPKDKGPIWEKKKIKDQYVTNK